MTINYLHRAPSAPVSPAAQQPDALLQILAIIRAQGPGIVWMPEVRQFCQDKIELYLIILDALDGDADLEDAGDDEPSLGSSSGSQLFWSRGFPDDREDGDDSGIADVMGLAEQRSRHLGLIVGGAS